MLRHFILGLRQYGGVSWLAYNLHRNWGVRHGYNTQGVVQIDLPEAKAKGPSNSIPHFVLETAEKHLFS